ncbi:unnamed protein product [Rhizophagus irregularis]|uniref:Uncharacterized protein n=1 Tax=Rhizophagus irregularis TaxID=588596 RepID=A0A2I1HJ77_9GLOM|nr:hypothetical protein RhiirA4_481267 [Rhizophagus irregularis]CAB4431052.1 unnamed protein product [Rhizophagus irregularis]
MTKDKFFRPFFIDCRAGQFDTPANVYDSIRSEFKDFFKDFKEFLSKNFGAKFTVAYQDIEVALQLSSNNNVREITSVDVRNLLRDIKNCLPIWSFWNSYDLPAPILIIDEANMFSQLGNSDPDLLRSILNWMVLNTK